MSPLAQSERRYRRLFEAAQDGILLLDIDTGQITDSNPFMSEMLGYSPEALLGKELWQFGLFKDREASKAAFRHLYEAGYIRYENLPLETSTGERREVEFVSNVYKESGQTVIQCNIRDITERKRIERALQAALVRELRITKALQHTLTAEVAEEAFDGLLIAAYYEPALKEAEVGGDFFDALRIHTGGEGQCRITLAVGDVTGKGLHAAVLAGRTKEVMRAFLHEDPDPARTLVRLNDYLCDSVNDGSSDDHSELLVALSLVVIDPKTGTALCSSAGAEPPVVLRADGSAEIITAHGILLGIQRDHAYPHATIQLSAGDAILQVTDGITEAKNGREFLGYEGMIELARHHYAASGTSSVRSTGKAIVDGARAFGGSFRDDVCLLLARKR